MRIDDPLVSDFVFHPRKEFRYKEPAGLATRTASGGETIGGYLHDRPENHVLMIFFHGNGEIAADYDDLARFYTACGVSFWVVDYRGYGNSTGTPSYLEMFTDADAVYQDISQAEQASGRTFEKVVVMGRSLGSASAIYLAAAHPERIDALLLDSPFADGPALIRRLGGPDLTGEAPAGFRDNIDRMASVRQPCLILHGTRDWIIPVSDAEALYAACPSPEKKLVKIDGAGHNDLMIRGFDTYFAEIRARIESISA